MIFFLALKDLIKNYKKSFAIIIAVILSTILLSSVSIITDWIKESVINEAENLNGKYQLLVQYYNKNEFSEIEKILPDNCDLGKSTNCGVAKSDDINIVLSGADETYAQLNNFYLKEGDFPKAENEICLEEWLIKKINKNLKIGDELTLPLYFKTAGGAFSFSKGTEKNCTFILSGILSDTITMTQSGGSAGFGLLSLGGADSVNNNPLEGGGYVLSVKYNDISRVENDAGAIQKILSSPGYSSINKYLYNVQKDSQYFKFKLGFFIIISLVAILCIYNIFNIIMLEKKYVTYL